MVDNEYFCDGCETMHMGEPDIVVNYNEGAQMGTLKFCSNEA